MEKKEAADLFAAAAKDSANAEVVAQAGVALPELEDSARGAQVLRKALKLNPAASDVAFNLA